MYRLQLVRTIGIFGTVGDSIESYRREHGELYYYRAIGDSYR